MKKDGVKLLCCGKELKLQKGEGDTVRLATNSHGKDYDITGDICSPHQFTHAADFMARIVIQNALFFGRKKVSDLIIPWAIYTSPEIAHVGIHGVEAKEKGIEIDTFTQHFSEVDRAILDGETGGFVRVHLRKGGRTRSSVHRSSPNTPGT